MGPMVWWWRWWMGMDPNRDRRPSGVQGPADQHGAATDTRTRPPTTEDPLIEQLREEASQLRAQLVDLTRSGAEADRLRAELDQAHAGTAELRTQAEQAHAETDRLRAELELQQAETNRLRAEFERVDAELRTQLEQQHAETDRLRAELDRAGADAGGDDARTDDTAADDTAADDTAAKDTATDDAEATPTARSDDRASPDVSAAAAILGSPITLDDLTIIDGIGPKIAGLLDDAGIDTWRALADADVDRLREVLVDAGPRYRMHDPSAWPAQAGLLADGRWQELRDLKQS